LPETDAIAALQRVIAMNEAQELDLLQRDVTVVDMRTADRPILRMSPDAATAYRDAVLTTEPSRE
jgi:cell division protein FtsQ